MYIIDGIAYAGVPSSELGIAEFTPTGNLTAIVRFNTGEERIMDATMLLDMPAFKPLASEDVFEDSNIDHGILTWCEGAIDISPQYLYEQSFAYERIA